MLRRAVKNALLGRRTRAFRIRIGLNRGQEFLIDPAAKTSRLVGLDELELVRVFRRFAPRARTVFDVGAADGWYAVYCATRHNVHRVYAFEPDELSLEQLGANAYMNRCGSKIETVQKWVGDRVDPGWCRLDDYMDRATAPVLVKIDVEGGELDVLRGATRFLADRRTMWVIETHSKQMETECLRVLHEHGLKVRVVKNGWYRAFLPERRPLEHNRWIAAACE